MIDPAQLKIFVDFFSVNSDGMTSRKGIIVQAVTVQAIKNNVEEMVFGVPSSAKVLPNLLKTSKKKCMIEYSI